MGSYTEPARVSTQNGHAATLDPAAAVARLIHNKRVSDRTRAELSRHDPPGWCDLAEYLAESRGVTEPDDRLALARRWLHGYQQHHRAEALVIGGALDAALGGPVGDEAEAPAGPLPFSLGLLGSGAFFSRTYTREWLIKGVFVRGQPCIVGGPRKALKTSQLVDFVVSLASAGRFLGEFEVPRRAKTLFLSGESGDATIQETAVRVCASKGIDPGELEGWAFWGFRLPQLSNAEHMDALAREVRENGIEVVVVDPLYLCLLSGNGRLDPANLFDVGPLLARITEVCLEAGATPVLVHHLRKNRESPHDPPELEDLAFAGIQEFARQWVMIGRRERYEPGTGEHKLWLSVGGSAGHSGSWAVDVSEGVVDDEFGGRKWDVTVRRAVDVRVETRAEKEAAQIAKEAERAKARDEARARRLGEDAADALKALNRLGRATPRAWRDALNVSGERFGPVLAYLLDTQQIQPCTITAKCGKGVRKVDGYEPSSVSGCLHRDTPGHTGTHRDDTEASRCGTPGRAHRDTGGLSLPQGESPPPVPVSRCAGEPSEGGEEIPHRDESPGFRAAWERLQGALDGTPRRDSPEVSEASAAYVREEKRLRDYLAGLIKDGRRKEAFLYRRAEGDGIARADLEFFLKLQRDDQDGMLTVDGEGWVEVKPDWLGLYEGGIR